MEFMSLKAIFAYMLASFTQNNPAMYNLYINSRMLLYIWWDAGQWPEYISGYDNLCLNLPKKHLINIPYMVFDTVDCAIQRTIELFNTHTICPLWIPFDTTFRASYMSRLSMAFPSLPIVVLCPSLIHCIYYSRIINCRQLASLANLTFVDCPNLMKMLLHRDVSEYVFVIDHADIDNVMYSCIKDILSTMGQYLIHIKYLPSGLTSDTDSNLYKKYVGYTHDFEEYISPITADYVALPHNTVLLDNRKRVVPYVNDFGTFKLDFRYAASHELHGITYNSIPTEDIDRGYTNLHQVVGTDCYIALRWAILTIVGLYSGNKEQARIIWSNALFTRKVLTNSMLRLVEPVDILDLTTTFEHCTMYKQIVVVKRFDCYPHYTSTQFKVSSVAENVSKLQLYICLEQYNYANSICHMLCVRKPIFNVTKPMPMVVVYPFSNYMSYNLNNSSNTYVRFDMNSVVCGRVESTKVEETTNLPMIYYMLIIRIISAWRLATLGNKYKSDKAHLHNLIRFVKSY